MYAPSVVSALALMPAQFSVAQTSYKGPPSLVFDVQRWCVPRGLSSLDIKSNFYFLLVLKLIMGRTIRPRPQVCLHNVHRQICLYPYCFVNVHVTGKWQTRNCV
jgi:hypothetical protein